MENKEIMKQMVNLYKTSFENSYSTMVMIQDHAEKLFKNFIDHVPGINDEGKKVIEQWNIEYKKRREDLKKAMNEGYEKIETFLDDNSSFMSNDPSNNIFNTLLSQANWTPNDFKKSMDELAGKYKNGYDEFKKYVDKNISNMGNFFSTTYKTHTKTKQQK